MHSFRSTLMDGDQLGKDTPTRLPKRAWELSIGNRRRILADDPNRPETPPADSGSVSVNAYSRILLRVP